MRIGFAPSLSQNWLGGVNYYSNLFRSVSVLDDAKTELVLFADPRDDCSWVPAWSRMTIVRSPLLRRGSLVEVARRVDRRLRGRDDLLAGLLRRRSVTALSHSWPLGRRRIPTAGWIPDLQHRHLPHFFSARERARRDQEIMRFLDQCHTVFVSSVTARNDIIQFYESSGARISVLPFVAAVPDRVARKLDALQKKYSLPASYFHLPNQFWKHKNHRIVMQAIRKLNKRGCRVCVVCTGSTEDYRNPEYFDELMREFQDLQSSLRVLGVVPSPDLYGIMRGAVGILNPSLFEGWSTTVEECKSMGKRVLLSDIAVHREQAPGRAIYFDPYNANELADHILGLLSSYDPADDANAAETAARELPIRQRIFAQTYLGAMRKLVEQEANS